jgi:hypothetical protein
MNLTNLPSEIITHIIGSGFLNIKEIFTLRKTFENNKKLCDVVIYCLKQQLCRVFPAPAAFSLFDKMDDYELNQVVWLANYDELDELVTNETMLKDLICNEVKDNRTNIIELLHYNGAPIAQLCMDMYGWRNHKNYSIYEKVNDNFIYEDCYASDYQNETLLIELIHVTASTEKGSCEYDKYGYIPDMANKTRQEYMLESLLIGAVTGLWYNEEYHTEVLCLNYNPETLEIIVPAYLPIDHKFINDFNILELFMNCLNINPDKDLNKISRILKYLKSQGIDDNFLAGEQKQFYREMLEL